MLPTVPVNLSHRSETQQFHFPCLFFYPLKKGQEGNPPFQNNGEQPPKSGLYPLGGGRDSVLPRRGPHSGLQAVMRGFPAPSSASPHAALCSQLILFQLPDVLAHRMFVHAHCLADGSDAEPALVGLLTFASPRETVHRQFACIESQEKPFIGQREKIPCPLCLLCLGVLTDGQGPPRTAPGNSLCTQPAPFSRRCPETAGPPSA